MQIADEVASECRYQVGSDNQRRVWLGAYKGAYLALSTIDGLMHIASNRAVDDGEEGE